MTIKPRKLKTGWQARYTGADGRQYSAGIYKGIREAQRAAAAKETEVASSQWHDPNRGKVSFAEYAPTAMRRHAESISPRSLSNMGGNVRNHLLPRFGKYSLRAITSDLVHDWWLSMPANGARKSSYANLRTIMNYAIKSKHIDVTPCDVPKWSTEVSTPHPDVTEEEAWRVIAACPIEVRAALVMMLGGAFRIGETLGFNRAHVDLETGSVHVEQQWVWEPGGSVVRNKTKTGKERDVVLPSWAIDELKAYFRTVPTMMPMSPLFITPRGNRLSRGYIYRALNLAKAEVGVPQLVPHCLRGTSLTAAMVATGDLFAVMKRAGHSDVRSAARYQRVGLERDIAIAEAMSKRIRGANS